ncbi:unnamed protein product [Prunus armeniaca]|uniref:GRF-type domain-containing protein n=1 Tax=Prunus armeniaca TaxID=36596 RepID=A0A6J5Y2Q1_PRUAR|nr:unnamed protein product [Prunus armeniaca]
MNNQSNLKRSYIEMAEAADHISSTINHFHSSSSNDMVEPQTAMADDACIQPQPQPQQQQQQPHIALPPLVEDLLNQLCNKRKQPQPGYDVRRRLGLLGEEKALQLLHEIDEAKVIKTLSGFIMWMILNKPQYQCPSPSPSPSKYAPVFLLQTQLSASPFTPSVHKDHGGLRPPYSYSSASSSKALRVSPYQGPSYAPPSTITPVRLFKDPLLLPQPFPQDGGAEMWHEAVLGKYCKCGKQAILRTSWTDFNPGRRFYVCGTQGTSRRCDLWEWADPEMCDRSKQIIPMLLRHIKTTEEELQLQRAKIKKIRFWLGSCLLVTIILVLSMLSKSNYKDEKHLKLKLMR